MEESNLTKAKQEKKETETSIAVTIRDPATWKDIDSNLKVQFVEFILVFNNCKQVLSDLLKTVE